VSIYDEWIGQPVCVRTAAGWTTIGVLAKVAPAELLLTDAAWVASSGRWAQFTAGNVSGAEVEPFAGPVIVPRIGSEVSLWGGTLPQAQR